MTGSLTRVEIRRLTSRRLVRILIALALLGFLAGSVVAFTQFSRPTPQIQAQAENRRDADLAQSEVFRQQCLDDPTIPEADQENFCGTQLTADNLPIDQYISTPPFRTALDLQNGALAVAVATAALAFVIGATYVGAEWSTRSMVALLFWEPRRLRVVTTKIAVIAAAAAALGALGQVLWLGVGTLLARTRGVAEVLPAGFWGGVAGQLGRGVGLVVLAALLGFALANLTRNTGAALGVAFVYVAVVETALRALWSGSQAYLVTNNAVALVLDGGLRLFIQGPTIDSANGSFSEGTELIIGNLRGGLTLSAYALVLLVLGGWLFRRRDLH